MSGASGRVSAVLATLLLLACGHPFHVVTLAVATSADSAHPISGHVNDADPHSEKPFDANGAQLRRLLQAVAGTSSEQSNASSQQPAWACPSGSNITEASHAAIMAQPCVAAVGFPGKLRCGDAVLASPKLVLEVQFNLCTRIQVCKN